MKKFFKRIAVAVAAVSVLAAVPFMSGCESSHPEAVITISYNGVDYQLNYRLYRSMYPQTVKHFIELADAGFYDMTIIHNYISGSYMYGGGYSYSGESYNGNGYDSAYEDDYEEGQLGMLDYFEYNSKEQSYLDLFASGAITPSVYRDFIDGNYVDPLPTVIGEVGNTHNILHGALTGGFGALRMYYSNKTLDDDTVDYSVYLDKDNNADGILIQDYLQHSATSQFSIQLSTAAGSSNYCIFAQLIDTQPLADLTTAIESNTLTVENVPIDNLDMITGPGNTASYTVTELPLIVKSVEITKY